MKEAIKKKRHLNHKNNKLVKYNLKTKHEFSFFVFKLQIFLFIDNVLIKSYNFFKEVFMKIVYKWLTKDDYKNVVKTFGEVVEKYNVLKFGKNYYAYGAFYNDELIGFISGGFRSLIPPLTDKEAYIYDVEVKKEYRRNGIGSKFVKMAEKWAKENNAFQIGAWSAEESKEMIMLAKKLKYSLI